MESSEDEKSSDHESVSALLTLARDLLEEKPACVRCDPNVCGERNPTRCRMNQFALFTNGHNHCDGAALRMSIDNLEAKLKSLPDDEYLMDRMSDMVLSVSCLSRCHYAL